LFKMDAEDTEGTKEGKTKNAAQARLAWKQGVLSNTKGTFGGVTLNGVIQRGRPVKRTQSGGSPTRAAHHETRCGLFFKQGRCRNKIGSGKGWG